MTADAATTVRPPQPEGLARFDRVERIVHWTTAGLFGVLMLTGAALYAGPISTLVGRRELIRTIHVVAGVSLPIPILVGIIGRWGGALRLDLSRLNRWRADDRAWLRKSKRAAARLGKFNPGQKLNAVFLGAAILVMLGSGSIMKWFSLFPLDWRTGATFVHDWFALAIWLSIAGHIFLALRDPDALEGMKRGVVTRRWARTKRPLWYEEVTGEPAQPVAETTRPS
jgi:formate dehydrogenase subunit gamma